MRQVELNGITYRVNRHGVVFAPSTPDPHFPGWENLNFPDMETARLVLAKLEADDDS